MRLLETNDSKEVEKFLGELADSISVDKAIVSGQDITIRNVYKNGQLQRTGIYAGKRSLKDRIGAKGKHYTSLANVLNTSIKQEVIDGDDFHHTLEILALLRQEPFKSPEGDVTTYWIKYEPYNLFDWKNGNPHFNFEKITLSESWTAVLTQVPIAIRYDSTLYALSEDALISLGKLLDANSAIRKMDDNEANIFLAGEIAAKLANINTTLNIVSWGYQKDDPLRVANAIGGKRLTLWRQDELFRKVFSLASSMPGWVASIGEWNASHSSTSINICLKPVLKQLTYEVGLKLQMTDGCNVATSLTLYTVNNGMVSYHLQNKVQKRTDLTDDTVAKLFSKIEENLNKLPESIKEIVLTEDDIKSLKMIIGSERLRKSKLTAGTYQVDQYMNSIEATLPSKQAVEFRIFNGTLLKEAI